MFHSVVSKKNKQMQTEKHDDHAYIWKIGFAGKDLKEFFLLFLFVVFQCQTAFIDVVLIVHETKEKFVFTTHH